MKGWRLLIVLLMTLFTLSCGGSSSSDDETDNNTDNTNNTTDTDTSPSISGFDFTLTNGDFWEYEWDYYTSTVYSGGGSSGTQKGVFRVTLGTPVIVGELTAYPLIISGNNRDGIDGADPFISSRWTHIAITNNQILLSSDGLEFNTVFDASTGFVIGFGFFEELSDQNLFEISTGTIDNDYITESAYVLSDSDSASNCEYFPSYGTICGAADVDYTLVRREYYQQDVGPIGYYYHYSASTGGTFDSVHVTNTINIGLVASSLRGDVVDYALENEPNNTPASASPITFSSLPVSVKGDFSYQDDIDVTLPENYASNHYLYLNAGEESEPNDSLAGAEAINLNESVHGSIASNNSGEFRSFTIPGYTVSTSIEDWYLYQMAEARPFDLLLEFFGAADGVDIDIWLFNDSGDILQYAYDDNAQADGSDDIEYLRPDLVAGNYYIGVDIWPNASDSSVMSGSYTLSLNTSSFGAAPAVTNQVAIMDYYRFTVQSAGSLTITTRPSLGVFITETDGETVLASAPVDLDDQTTNTVLSTPVLQPGDYLIGVGRQNYHSATENSNFDTYLVTIDN